MFAIKNVENSFFLRFIFTFYYMGMQGVTGGLQGVTGGYSGLQRITGGYKGLQKTFF